MSHQESAPQTPSEAAAPSRKMPTVSRLGAEAVSLALKHSPEKIRHRLEDVVIQRLLNSKRFEVRPLVDVKDTLYALALEQEVWHEEDYGDLQVYEKYLPQSRIFAAFDGQKCVGMNRLFEGSPELPPFIEEMPFYDQELRQQLIEDSKNLKVEEFGTVAVQKELRNGRIFLDLCRLSYRNAAKRDIKTWGIIMEPERVQKMNTFLGFTFEQIGPTVDYQGGDCAAHIMHLANVSQSMSASRPKLYNWFVEEPLDG